MQASRSWVLLAVGNNSCTCRGGRKGWTQSSAGCAHAEEQPLSAAASKETPGSSRLLSHLSPGTETFVLLQALYS